MNSDRLRFMAEAEFCRNEPQPDEQASLSSMLAITPSRMKIDFMSCPPMSSTNETSGSTY